MSIKIQSIQAREILSSSAHPTLETEVTLENGITGRASVPFGASSGKYEAVTLVDNDPNRYCGLGMLTAVKNVNEIIAPALVGMDALLQKDIDAKLISFDPTPRKEKIGGNSTLCVSFALARAAGAIQSIPLYKYIREAFSIEEEIKKLPKPMMVVMEGGKHADAATDFQEYMVATTTQDSAKECVRAAIEVYLTLEKILKKMGHNVNVGSEGAYAATGFNSNREPLELIKKAITQAGYDYSQTALAIDPAASEFYESGFYQLAKEGRKLTSQDLTGYYKALIEEFPIISIEDPFGEDDWDSWQSFNKTFGKSLMVVGDDLTVTQTARVQIAVEKNAINSVIIKPNQVGTLSETIETVNLAKKNGLKIVVSHRGGGETTDTFIIDLSVAVGADFVKVGPSRGERVDKYNRLMEIGEELGM